MRFVDMVIFLGSDKTFQHTGYTSSPTRRSLLWAYFSFVYLSWISAHGFFLEWVFILAGCWDMALYFPVLVSFKYVVSKMV